jgi:hypothetical protein
MSDSNLQPCSHILTRIYMYVQLLVNMCIQYSDTHIHIIQLNHCVEFLLVWTLYKIQLRIMQYPRNTNDL